METGAVLAETSGSHEKNTRSNMTFQFELEDESSPHPNSTSHSSLQSLKEVIAFASNDKDNPHNWSNGKKSFVVFNGVALVRVSVDHLSLF
jgi:hypothetical protein